MKNRDIIRAIKKESKSLIPDMKPEIMRSLPFDETEKPQRETPRFYKKPIFAVALIVVCVAVALLMTYIFYNPQETVEISDSYVSVDINPSIELTADKNDIVKTIRPMNADAAVLIFGENFIGMNIGDACVKIVELATDMGYITETGGNAIKIVGINNNQQHETAVSNKIVEKVQTYLTQNSIAASVSASGNPSKEHKKTAKQNGVTVGKMALINELREKYPDITFEEAKTKSVKEINELLKSYDKNVMDNIISELETEYDQAEQENQAELQEEIAAIENKYAGIVTAINTILSLAEDEGNFLALKNAVNAFNNDYPDQKFSGKILIQRRNQIKKHFEDLSVNLQYSFNEEKKEIQNNAKKEMRQQLKNKWKNQYNSGSNKN